MDILNHLRVQTRLLLLLGVTFFALLLIGIIGAIYIPKIQDQLDAMYHGGIEEIHFLKLVGDQYNTLTDTLYRVQNGTVDPSEATQVVKEGRQSITTNWNEYLTKPILLSKEALVLKNEIMTRLPQGIKQSDDFLSRVQNALQNHNREQVSEYVTNDLAANFDPVKKDLNQLITLYIDDTKLDYENALGFFNSLSMISAILFIATFLISILLAVLIIKSIVSPLKYAVKNVDHIADGDTTNPITMTSGGELGSLLTSLQNMIDSSKKMSSTLSEIAAGDLTTEVKPRSDRDTLGISLHHMVTQMRTMNSTLSEIASGNLATEVKPRSDRDTLGISLHHMVTQMRAMINEIKEGVNNLTASSQEMMTSVSQLSAGAAETAAAVTETTTTAEELKQTAHLSSDKAKDVLSNIEETIQTLKLSEKSVVDTITDINQIHERMKIISDSILKLSEKSLAIAEIMDTVNDLAEQSNLLAVNAAIEAAKAGEQGRSFGVVAQEIRTLAEQSKGATVQVKSLLGEIQNATNAAVLATEQGSKAVAKGVDQSTQTNTSIKELASNMSKVIQAANQISLSSQQQLIGVEQVTVAMSNVSEATNQHVEQLRQIESAIGTLNQMGNTLKELTDQYQLVKERVNETPRKYQLSKMHNQT